MSIPFLVSNYQNYNNGSITAVNINPSSGTLALRNGYITRATNIQTISVIAGDIILVFYSAANSNILSTCTDNAVGGSNVYTVYRDPTYAHFFPNASVSCDVFTAVAKANETVTVTVTSDGSAVDDIAVQVISGALNSSYIDTSVVYKDAAASASTFAGASLTTTNPNDYLSCFWISDAAGVTWTENGQGFTIANQSITGANSYRIVSSTGTYNDAVTTSGATLAASVIVALKAASVSVAQGGTQQFTATVTGTGSYSSAVTWSASVGSITSDGLFTAPGSGASATITATSVQDNTKSMSTVVTLTGGSTVTSVTVSPNPVSVALNGTQAFTATVNGTNSPSQSVTWSASVGSFTGNVYTAPSSGASATITATSVQDNTKSGTSAVTLTSGASTVTSVTVSPSIPTVYYSTTQNFTATVAGTNSPSQSVTWSASVGSITSPGGVFTAPASGASATITATSVQDNTKSGTATATLTSAPAGISVKTYGAYGDGIHDDSAAIQSCINYVSGLNNNTTMIIPDGIYMINTNYNGASHGLRAGSNMTISLSSGAVLKAIVNGNATGSILTIGTVSNVTIIGSGTFQGDRTNGITSTQTHLNSLGEDNHCLLIGSANNISITGITFKEAWGDGVYVTNSSTNVSLTNCIIDHNYRMGMAPVAVDGLTVTNCTFSNTGMDGPCLPGGGSGFDFESNVGQVTTNCTLSYCTATRNAQIGISLGGRDPYGTINITVDHCTCSDNGDTGLYANDYSRDSFFTNNLCERNGSLSTGYGGDGIGLGGNPYTTNMTVTGNIVNNNYHWGIGVASAIGAVVTGNTGYGNASGAGVHDYGGSSGCTLSPNTIT
jgi:hypothetical protein